MGKIIKYNMQLDVLTPVHIGGADYKSKLDKKEYIFDKNTKTLTIIDNVKFIDFLSKKGLLDRYINYIEDKVNNKINVQERVIKLENFLRQNNIYNDLKNFTKKTYKNISVDIENMNDIKLLGRTINAKPYIQGSSIKGALINLLLVDYIINNRNEFIQDKKKIFFELNDKKETVKNVKRIQEKILFNENSYLKETKK